MSPPFYSYLIDLTFWQYAKLLKKSVSSCFRHHKRLTGKPVYECFTLYKCARCRELTLMWLFPSLSQSLSVLGCWDNNVVHSIWNGILSFQIDPRGKVHDLLRQFLHIKRMQVAEHTIT